MPKFPSVSAKDFLKLLLSFGCEEIGIRGSHHKVRNPSNNLTTVIPVHAGRDIKKPLMLAVLNQLGISPDEFLKHI